MYEMKIFFVLILLILIIGYFAIDMYQNLPDRDQKLPKPENFLQIKRDIQKGIFYSLENLSKEYYLQPDFYPSYKSDSSHDYTRWGVHGYGAYPGEISYNIKNFKKDQYINIYTFVKASDDIETFQGMKFDFDIFQIENQSNIININNSQLFDIYINPNTVMFAPTFPKRSEYIIESREYEWAYKLKVTITAKKDVPTGIYEFRLKALSPDENIKKLYYEDIQKIDQKWYKCPENEKDECNDNVVESRKRTYINGGQFQAGKFFDIIINVE